MTRAAVSVNLIAAAPRTRWFAADYATVATTLALCLAALAALALQTLASVANLQSQERSVAAENARLAARTAPIQRKLSAVTSAALAGASRDTQRRSGLTIASRIDLLASALGSDATATSIDSSGQIDGFAQSYPALARIWERLGTAYIISDATPTASGTIRFHLAAVNQAGALTPQTDRSRPPARLQP